VQARQRRHRIRCWVFERRQVHADRTPIANESKTADQLQQSGTTAADIVINDVTPDLHGIDIGTIAGNKAIEVGVENVSDFRLFS